MTGPLRPARAVLPAALLLCVAVAAVYRGAGEHPYTGLDDPGYVTANPHVLRGLAADGVRWAFTTFHVSNWHPLAWLSHMADVSLFGPGPAWPHRVNVLLHLLASLALLLALWRMTGAPWRSALAAALFALHPLHVEPVAWVSERKELLCALFSFLSLAAWHRRLERGGAAWSGAALGAYALALLSKPMAVTLPFLLLLLDRWPLGRLRLPGEGGGVPPGTLLAEKAPFFLLSAASCAVTYLAQSRGGAVQGIALGERLLNASASWVAYLGKTAWPAGLAVFYPHPAFQGGTPAWKGVGAALLLAAATAAVVLAGRRRPFLPVGWFWYLGTLVPVIGIVQVGGQAMADRYTYLPLVGIFVAVAWAVPDPPGGWDGRRKVAAAAALLLLLLPLSVQARRQFLLWRDNETLFRHAAAATRGNWVALSGVATALLDKGRPAEAVPFVEEALRANPGNAVAWTNLGNGRKALGDAAGALEAYDRAAALDPGDPYSRGKAGVVLFALGRPEEGTGRFREAVALDPSWAEGWYNLGSALLAGGRAGEAEGAFREAARLRPGHADTFVNLGAALASLGRKGEAEAAFREALRIDPSHGGAAANLARLRGE